MFLHFLIFLFWQIYFLKLFMVMNIQICVHDLFDIFGVTIFWKKKYF